MMSGVPLETRWAFSKFWHNKFYYKVASCWLFLLILFYLGKSLPLRVWNWMKIAPEINYHFPSLREELSKYSHPTPDCFLYSKRLLCTESNVHEEVRKTNLSKWWIILKQFREWLSVSWYNRWLRKALTCCTEGAGSVLTLEINCFNIINSVHIVTEFLIYKMIEH